MPEEKYLLEALNLMILQKKVTDGKLTIENSKIIIMERINYLKKYFKNLVL